MFTYIHKYIQLVAMPNVKFRMHIWTLMFDLEYMCIYVYTYTHKYIHAYIQLVAMPNVEFRMHMWMLMLFDLGGSLLVELFASVFFYKLACTGSTDELLR
jgi:hypothetical protein